MAEDSHYYNPDHKEYRDELRALVVPDVMSVGSPQLLCLFVFFVAISLNINSI
ncbi:MAG: hypothetical protein AAF649_06330 [Verrucomicrobiota bacterium]